MLEGHCAFPLVWDETSRPATHTHAATTYIDTATDTHTHTFRTLPPPKEHVALPPLGKRAITPPSQRLPFSFFFTHIAPSSWRLFCTTAGRGFSETPRGRVHTGDINIPLGLLWLLGRSWSLGWRGKRSRRGALKTKLISRCNVFEGRSRRGVAVGWRWEGVNPPITFGVNLTPFNV